MMPAPNTLLPDFAVPPSVDLLTDALEQIVQLATRDAEGFDAVIRRLPTDIHPQEFGRFASLYLTIILQGHSQMPTGKQMASKAMEIDVVQAARIVGLHIKTAQQAAITAGPIPLDGPMAAGLSHHLSKSLLALSN